MANPPDIAKDIADYLNTLGYTDPVTVEILAPTPINQYAVITYAGTNVKTHGGTRSGGATTIALDVAYVQIQCRNASRQTAKSNLRTVADALDGLAGRTINSTNYTDICEVSCVRPFAKQNDGSSIFIWEARIQSKRL